MVLTDFAQYLKNNVHTYIEIYRDVRFKFYVFALESVDFAASSQCEPLVICNVQSYIYDVKLSGVFSNGCTS
jgi:hypothetical protein